MSLQNSLKGLDLIVRIPAYSSSVRCLICVALECAYRSPGLASNNKSFLISVGALLSLALVSCPVKSSDESRIERSEKGMSPSD
eukprot:840774-Prymnesium_polylepis.1